MNIKVRCVLNSETYGQNVKLMHQKFFEDIASFCLCPRIWGHRLSEQCLMSPPTQYRLSGRQFYWTKDPTNSIKVGTNATQVKKTQKKQTTQNTAIQ